MLLARPCALILLLAGTGFADPASRLFDNARKAERRGDTIEAFSLYVQAAGMKPGNAKYRQQVERLQPRALQSLAMRAALQTPAESAAPDPQSAAGDFKPAGSTGLDSAGATLSPAEVREAVQALPPPELKPRTGRQSFDLRGNVQALYEQVAKAYGVEVVLDADLPPGSSLRFRLAEVDFYRAFRALMELTGTFVVPINERVALVAADNQNKRRDLEPVMAALLPIPQVMTVEEANEVGRAVQQALDIRRLVVDPNRRQVYVRDTVTRVRLAKALYEDLSRRRGEVMLEVDLLNVSLTTLSNLGLVLPTEVPVLALGTIGNAPPPQVTGAPLAAIGGGDTRFGVQIGSAALVADGVRSQGQLLTSFRLRATDGLPASLHVGDRYPIVTARFSPIVITDEIRDLDQQGRLLEPFPSFTFEDLGLVLKVTPRLHGDREVSLAIETEFRLLTGATLNELPVISSRSFHCTVRLREGEIGLISGMAALQVSRSWTGFAPLVRIPLLGRLFRRNTWQHERSDLLLAIRPRLTQLPPGEQFAAGEYHYGTESRPVSPL
jgi:general secretion pathway protein D